MLAQTPIEKSRLLEEIYQAHQSSLTPEIISQRCSEAYARLDTVEEAKKLRESSPDITESLTNILPPLYRDLLPTAAFQVIVGSAPSNIGLKEHDAGEMMPKERTLCMVYEIDTRPTKQKVYPTAAEALEKWLTKLREENKPAPSADEVEGFKELIEVFIKSHSASQIKVPKEVLLTEELTHLLDRDLGFSRREEWTAACKTDETAAREHLDSYFSKVGKSTPRAAEGHNGSFGYSEDKIALELLADLAVIDQTQIYSADEKATLKQAIPNMWGQYELFKKEL